jgi:hypothetical protein
MGIGVLMKREKESEFYRIALSKESWLWFALGKGF